MASIGWLSAVAKLTVKADRDFLPTPRPAARGTWCRSGQGQPRGAAFMGLKAIKIGAREAVELACDNVAHHEHPPIAWFDCGSDLGNLATALSAGWERHKANGMWLCPRCVQQIQKRDLISPLTHSPI
jgi:hypothetical protein